MAKVKILALGLAVPALEQRPPVIQYLDSTAALDIWQVRLRAQDQWSYSSLFTCAHIAGQMLAEHGPLTIVFFTYLDAPNFPAHRIMATVHVSGIEFTVLALLRCQQEGERCSFSAVCSAIADPAEVGTILDGFVDRLPNHLRQDIQDELQTFFPPAGNCLLLFHHSPYSDTTQDICYSIGTWEL